MEPDVVSHPHGIRLRLLGLVALVSLALSWIALKLWTNAGHLLPPASWAALPVLLVMAAGLYAAGRPVRRLISGTATTPVSPLYAARVLGLAQAAALAGAAALGWYAAQVLLLVPDADIESQQRRLLTLAALGLGAVVLAAAGLLVQRMCRLDDREPWHEQDEDDDQRPPHSRR